MSDQRKIENLKVRKIKPEELKYIDSMADLLAKESGIAKDWIKNVLQLTIPQWLPIDLPEYKKYPAQLLYQFRPCLFEAMRWMSKDTIKELFSSDLTQLYILEINYGNLINEVPFIKFESLLPLANEFQTYLAEEAKNIIRTGYPSKHFENSHYLEKTFLSGFGSRIPDSITSQPKEKYLKRQIQFEEGILSKDFLEKVLGPECYREFAEIEHRPQFVFNPELFAENDRLIKKIRQTVRDLKVNQSLKKLRDYLIANKLRVPADLDERDETFRANLHLFSQNAFKKIVDIHLNKKHGTALSEIWKLIGQMPHEHLELIFNGHLGYFGLGEYDFQGQILYTYGQNLLLNILTAAAFIDESGKKDFMLTMREHLEPVIDDFTDPSTGELHTITYSLYQAMDLCGQDRVVEACKQLALAKTKISGIKSSIKKTAHDTVNFSYERLKAISDQALLMGYLGRTGGVDDIKTLQSLRSATAVRQRFDENFTEYRCLNTAYGIFDFSTKARSAAIEVMFNNYEAGEKRTSVRELVYAIYQDLPEKEKEAKLLLKGNSIWRLEKGPLKDHDAVKYGMIRMGAKKYGNRAYILDFSFEDRSPDEQLKLLKSEQKEREEKVKAKYKDKVDIKIEKKNARESEESKGLRRKFGDIGIKKSHKKSLSKK